MKLLFRVDCNYKIGFGHFSRCLNLARTFLANLQALEILFVGNYNSFSLQLLKTYQISFEYVESDCFDVVFPMSIHLFDLTFIDTYLLSQDQLNSLRRVSDRLIFLDDSGDLDYDGFFCVINFRHNADKLFAYKSKYSLLGSQYLILKPELVAVRNTKESYHGSFSKLLLFTGGSPLHHDYISNVIEFLCCKVPETQITHVGAPALCNSSYCNYTNVRPCHDIETYLTSTDVVINTGGLFKYESSFCCIPTASFYTSALQASDSQILSVAGLHADLGPIESFDPLSPPASFVTFVDDAGHRFSLSSSSISTFLQNPTLNLVRSLTRLL